MIISLYQALDRGLIKEGKVIQLTLDYGFIVGVFYKDINTWNILIDNKQVFYNNLSIGRFEYNIEYMFIRPCV